MLGMQKAGWGGRADLPFSKSSFSTALGSGKGCVLLGPRIAVSENGDSKPLAKR